MIKDVKCGATHNVVLDINGDVYSWGSNGSGQCGQEKDDEIYIYKPKLIESFKEYVVDCIDCGYDHSYVKTVDKRHYLFGGNCSGQCIAFTFGRKISRPSRVDQKIISKCNVKEIIQSDLGRFNTKVTVSM